MATLKIIPKFSYGSGPTVLTLTIPQKHWNQGAKSLVGGSDIAGSGVGESYNVLWSEWMQSTIRFTDAEFDSVKAWWIAVARSLDTFSFWPDKLASALSVRLHAPTITEGFEPKRIDGYPWAWEFTFTVRASDNATSLTTAIP